MEGQSVFVCPNCGAHFKSVDIDYRTTDKAIPMACPNCGTLSRDRHWNQTNIPDGWLIALILGCIISPIVLWRGTIRLLNGYYRRQMRDLRKNDEDKVTVLEKIFNFFGKIFARIK